jgi:esterase/lipase
MADIVRERCETRSADPVAGGGLSMPGVLAGSLGTRFSSPIAPNPAPMLQAKHAQMDERAL